MTTTTKTIVVLGALMLIGCGEEGAAAIQADAGNGTGGAAGMAGQVGGQAGSLNGTGGAPAAGGAIGDTFTRADHDMCMAWPVCPDGVFSVATDTARVLSNECKTTFDGGRATCGACMRKSTCEQFVGRCIAPILLGTSHTGIVVSATTPASCRGFLDSAPTVYQGGWVICTGDLGSKTAEGEGVNARTVCQD